MRRLVSAAFILSAWLLFLPSPEVMLAQEPSATPDAAVATPEPVFGGFEFGPVAGTDLATTEKGYFVFDIEPGAEATGQVRLKNPGSVPVVVELEAVDSLTAQAGGSAFAEGTEAPEAVGAWVHTDESLVTLEPDQQVLVEFVVRPPANTEPGQYLAGLTASAVEENEATPEALGANQAGAVLEIRNRYVIAVQVNVPGEWTPSMAITGAEALEQPSGTKLGIHLENDGDVFLQPTGTLVLRNAEATPILEERIEMGTFVTGTDVTYPVTWPGAPVAGEYGVDVELNYADGGIARYSGTFGVSEDAPVAPTPEGAAPQQPAVVTVPAESPIQPWMIYALLALLGAIVVLLVVLVLRGGRNRGRGV